LLCSLCALACTNGIFSNSPPQIVHIPEAQPVRGSGVETRIHTDAWWTDEEGESLVLDKDGNARFRTVAGKVADFRDGWEFVGKVCLPAGQEEFELRLVQTQKLKNTDQLSMPDDSPGPQASTTLLVYFEQNWLDQVLWQGGCWERPPTFHASFPLSNATFRVYTEGKQLVTM